MFWTLIKDYLGYTDTTIFTRVFNARIIGFVTSSTHEFRSARTSKVVNVVCTTSSIMTWLRSTFVDVYDTGRTFMKDSFKLAQKTQYLFSWLLTIKTRCTNTFELVDKILTSRIVGTWWRLTFIHVCLTVIPCKTRLAMATVITFL